MGEGTGTGGLNADRTSH